MTDKPRLSTVRWLSLREIAEMWSRTSGIPESAMLRELQYGVINIERLRAGQELFDVPPPDGDLPDPDAKVDRQWLMEFWTKQEDWPKPEFWSDKLDENGDRYPGRPSLKAAIVQELEKRAEAGELEDNLAEQARALYAWGQKQFPGNTVLPGNPHSIENQIRDQFKKLKVATKAAAPALSEAAGTESSAEGC